MRLFGGNMKILRFAAASLLVLAAASCGSDDSTESDATTGNTSAEATDSAPVSDSEPPSTEGGSSGEVRGVTDSEITIGGLSTVANAWPGVDTGAEARFARVNAEGGVAGRTINYIGTNDDGGDATRNLEMARDLVLNDKVFAIVPATSTGLLPQSSDFLEAEKVPYIGWGFMPGYCGSSFGFGFNGCLIGPENQNVSLAGPLVEAMDLPEGSTVAIQSWDNAPGRESENLHKGAWEHFGLEVVHWSADLPGDDSPTDLTPFVQTLTTSDDGQAPDVIVVNAGFNLVTALTGALKDAGYEGYVVGFVTYLPDLLASDEGFATAMDGAFSITQWLPGEFGGDAIDQIRADLEAIGKDPVVTSNISIGYWSADLLIKMLEAVGEDLTPETFDAIINGEGFTYQSEFDSPGIGPVEFPKNHDVAVACSALVQANGTVFDAIQALTCY